MLLGQIQKHGISHLVLERHKPEGAEDQNSVICKLWSESQDVNQWFTASSREQNPAKRRQAVSNGAEKILQEGICTEEAHKGVLFKNILAL